MLILVLLFKRYSLFILKKSYEYFYRPSIKPDSYVIYDSQSFQNAGGTQMHTTWRASKYPVWVNANLEIHPPNTLVLVELKRYPLSFRRGSKRPSPPLSFSFSFALNESFMHSQGTSITKCSSKWSSNAI